MRRIGGGAPVNDTLRKERKKLVEKKLAAGKPAASGFSYVRRRHSTTGPLVRVLPSPPERTGAAGRMPPPGAGLIPGPASPP